MKGTLYGLVSRQFWRMLGVFPYLEDIALYPGNSGSVEDDCEQSNTAESCSLGATIHIVLAPIELSNGYTPRRPEPRSDEPERFNDQQLHDLESSLAPSGPVSISQHLRIDRLLSLRPRLGQGKRRAASSYSEMACLPVTPATWGWKPYLIPIIHSLATNSPPSVETHRRCRRLS